jgi:predicted patatin/cPLA2 family phospholipase
MNENRYRLSGAASRAPKAKTTAAAAVGALRRLSTLSLIVVASLAMPIATGVGASSFRGDDAIDGGVSARIDNKIAIRAGASTGRADCPPGCRTRYST